MQGAKFEVVIQFAFQQEGQDVEVDAAEGEDFGALGRVGW